MASDVIDAIVQVIKDADLTSLEELLAAVESLDGSKYTSDSFQVLEDAVSAARVVLDNPDRTESDLAEAYKQVSAAIRGLVMKGNKAALSAVMEKAQEILNAAEKYTPSSIAGLEGALAQAQTVYDNEDASQAEVNAATEALTDKLTAARLKGDVNGDSVVNTNDSTLLLRYNAELDTLDAQQRNGADVNGDGIADTKDAVLILKYSSEKISAF